MRNQRYFDQKARELKEGIIKVKHGRCPMYRRKEEEKPFVLMSSEEFTRRHEMLRGAR